MQLRPQHWVRSKAFLAMTLALPALNGCLWHTRKVPQAKMPDNVLSAPPERLVEIINRRYDGINALSADVTFTATQGGALNGSEKTITPFPGHILVRKPESLRVIGYVPIVHTPAWDMASDGQTFKLWIPHDNKVVEGSNTVTQVSSNSFENMRPYMFVDSMIIPKIDPDDLLSVTGDSDTVVNPKTRKLEIRPEYLLTVSTRQGNSNLLLTKRVIHFSRIDLRPIEEDIYGPDGQIQTQTIYGPLQTYGDQHFPGTVTIKWPLQEQQILVTIQVLRINLHLEDTTFQLAVPRSAVVQELK
jgi:outer membrane lipoprotein-sorting protein